MAFTALLDDEVASEVCRLTDAASPVPAQSPAELTEEDRREIASAAQQVVNNRVLRELARLVQAWKQEEETKKRAAFVVLAAFAAMAMLAGWWFLASMSERDKAMRIADACHAGEAMVRVRQDYDEGMRLLSRCLALPELTPSTRAAALRARAAGYAALRHYFLAVLDQEMSFEVQPASTSYVEFVEYASYLRGAGRVTESIAASRTADQIRNR